MPIAVLGSDKNDSVAAASKAATQHCAEQLVGNTLGKGKTGKIEKAIDVGQGLKVSYTRQTQLGMPLNQSSKRCSAYTCDKQSVDLHC
jgi:hypothetical protein